MQRMQTKAEGGGNFRAMCSQLGFSLLEYIVVMVIVFSMAIMGIAVFSSMRKNAYESRARQNYEEAERAVKAYWLSTGGKQGGYRRMTADYMNTNNPSESWIEVDASLLRGIDRSELPREYYASILILKDGGLPLDETIVVTISEPGTVYFARFQQADMVETLQLAYSDFVTRGSELPQARAMETPGSR